VLVKHNIGFSRYQHLIMGFSPKGGVFLPHP
jgi:hypothetical protein